MLPDSAGYRARAELEAVRAAVYRARAEFFGWIADWLELAERVQANPFPLAARALPTRRESSAPHPRRRRHPQPHPLRRRHPSRELRARLWHRRIALAHKDAGQYDWREEAWVRPATAEEAAPAKAQE